MSRNNRYRKDSESLNVFPAFTDLMSNAFMILSLFLLLALIQSAELNRKLQNAEPIKIDEKSGQFTFDLGKAVLSKPLKTHIKSQVIPDIVKVIKEKGGTIEFIQVIGYTDGKKNDGTSNLDNKLDKITMKQNFIKSLDPGSNADLGLMRALAVIQEIQKANLGIKFQAYSAGQLYDKDGKFDPNGNEDKERRRIEIRFIPYPPPPSQKK
jgi:hypothetical protein